MKRIPRTWRSAIVALGALAGVVALASLAVVLFVDIEAYKPRVAFPLASGPCAYDVVDARGHLVVPGLVNAHHHMYQTLTRAVPEVQDAELFAWLRGLYPIWSHLTPEMARVSAQVAMAELLLSGCTTSSDHLYLFPNGVRLDDTIEAAALTGLRFTATRGAMSVGRSQGGLPPDGLVEREAEVLSDMQRVVERWHDPAPGSTICSPSSCTSRTCPSPRRRSAWGSSFSQRTPVSLRQ